MKMSPIFVLAFLLSSLLVVVISQNPVEAATEWCVADREAPKEKLESALNWACAQSTDICLNIQQDKPCFLPNTLEDHASYAFTSYYQKFKSQGAVCDFGGVAITTNIDPRIERDFLLSSGDCNMEGMIILPVHPRLSSARVPKTNTILQHQHALKVQRPKLCDWLALVGGPCAIS